MPDFKLVISIIATAALTASVVVGLSLTIRSAYDAIECHTTASKMHVQSDYTPFGGCWVRGNNSQWKLLK